MLQFPSDFSENSTLQLCFLFSPLIIMIGISDQVKGMDQWEMTQYFEGDLNFCPLIYTK